MAKTMTEETPGLAQTMVAVRNMTGEARKLEAEAESQTIESLAILTGEARLKLLQTAAREQIDRDPEGPVSEAIPLDPA